MTSKTATFVELNKNIEKFNAQNIYEHPELIHKLLLPLEKWCLTQLLIMDSPLSTADLYNAKLIQQYFSYLKIKGMLTDSAIKREVVCVPQLREFLLLNHKRKIIDLGYNSLLSRETLMSIEDDLIKSNVGFPAYVTLSKSMESLEGWGIVTRRNEVGKKVKFYWVLSPAFFLKYGTRLKDFLYSTYQ